VAVVHKRWCCGRQRQRGKGVEEGMLRGMARGFLPTVREECPHACAPARSCAQQAVCREKQKGRAVPPAQAVRRE